MKPVHVIIVKDSTRHNGIIIKCSGCGSIFEGTFPYEMKCPVCFSHWYCVHDKRKEPYHKEQCFECMFYDTGNRMCHNELCGMRGKRPDPNNTKCPYWTPPYFD